MKKPIIGITLDIEESGNYSKFPWYAIRKNYLDCVYKFGGLPFPIFHETKAIKELCNNIDGLIITGGNFDINPLIYGNKNTNSRNKKNQRTNFELKIFNNFFHLNKPILGICGGEQLINVACGGNLIQDIYKITKNTINHEQQEPRDETSHKIKIRKESKLFEILNNKECMVNSAHHQSIKELGKDILLSAFSSDGIIEAIEHTKHKWCIGVQWHPEFLITNEDNALIDNFVKISKL